jgi:hypothetical protein
MESNISFILIGITLVIAAALAFRTLHKIMRRQRRDIERDYVRSVGLEYAMKTGVKSEDLDIDTIDEGLEVDQDRSI